MKEFVEGILTGFAALSGEHLMGMIALGALGLAAFAIWAVKSRSGSTHHDAAFAALGHASDWLDRSRRAEGLPVEQGRRCVQSRCV